MFPPTYIVLFSEIIVNNSAISPFFHRFLKVFPVIENIVPQANFTAVSHAYYHFLRICSRKEQANWVVMGAKREAFMI